MASPPRTWDEVNRADPEHLPAERDGRKQPVAYLEFRKGGQVEGVWGLKSPTGSRGGTPVGSLRDEVPQKL